MYEVSVVHKTIDLRVSIILFHFRKDDDADFITLAGMFTMTFSQNDQKLSPFQGFTSYDSLLASYITGQLESVTCFIKY